MTGTWDEDCAPLCCGACGATGVVLFHIPGGWGMDGEIPGRHGLCQGCGETDERFCERFRAHFGDIKLVTDTDFGQSGEVA